MIDWTFLCADLCPPVEGRLIHHPVAQRVGRSVEGANAFIITFVSNGCDSAPDAVYGENSREAAFLPVRDQHADSDPGAQQQQQQQTGGDASVHGACTGEKQRL